MRRRPPPAPQGSARSAVRAVKAAVTHVGASGAAAGGQYRENGPHCFTAKPLPVSSTSTAVWPLK
jgi:hypothetical protein